MDKSAIKFNPGHMAIINRYFYGVGTIGRDMVYTLISMYMMYYLTDVLNLTRETMLGVTGVFMVMRIFDAVNDPFMGMIVDNTKSRFGKFKPWILIGAVLSAVFTVLMFTDFKLQGAAFLFVFALLYLLWEVAFTANDIAYWSMLPALSQDQKERERIGSFARICANIGLFALVAAIVPITKALTGMLGSEQYAYMALAIILSILMMFFQIIMLVLVREDREKATVVEATPLKEIFSVILRNDQLLWVTVSMSLFMIGYMTTTSFGLHYFEYIFGNKDMYTVFALVLGISQIAALAVFPLFSKKFSRKQLYLFGTILVVLGYLIFFFFDKTMTGVALGGILLFVGEAFIQLLILMFIADCVEYGQYKLGRRNDSITLSLQPLINKLGGAIASGIVGFTLVWSGVKGASGPRDVTREGALLFKTSMLILPLILILLSYIIYARKYKIDEKMYAEIIAALDSDESKK